MVLVGGVVMSSVNILAFGDSITYGEGDTELGGWVNRLRLHLVNRDNNDYNIHNLGICGQITEEILNRFDSEYNARYDKEAETIVIFAIGINDTQIVNGEDRVAAEQFKSNITELIRKARSFTDKILFVGFTNIDESKVSPIPWDPYKSYSNNKVKDFDNILENTCKEEQADYLKLFGLLELNEMIDGLHPNPAGYEKMFKRISNKLDTLMK